MKRLPVILLVLGLVLLFQGCSFFQSNQVNLRTDQDFINYALDAERTLYGLVFINNPALLRQYHIKPVSTRINTKQDLGKVLDQYWDSEIIDSLWQEGSKFMPNQPFGFYSDIFTDLGLLEAKRIRVKRQSAMEVIVSGEVQVPASEVAEGYNYTAILIIKRTPSGWKVQIGK